MSEDIQTLKDHYELAIVGCGPAGMAAALNAKIRNRDFILLGSEFCSPKLSKAPQIDNWLGFPEISGEDLRQRFLNHLREKDIPIVPFKITNIYPGPPFTLVGKEKSLEADALILATGVSISKLFPGEAELLGLGLGYCATCDGPLYKNKRTAIISYNQEGEDEANFMANICSKVYYIPYYSNPLQLDSRVEVKKSKVQGIIGSQSVEKLDFGEEQLAVDGVFIIRENLPAEQLVSGLEMENGSIKVNHNLETNLPGLFAAGDCTGQPYQLIKAAGEGGTAALQAVKYLDSLNSPERKAQGGTVFSENTLASR
ncbi:NAD(P)/FAD-dependent oxidoreductase [Desulfosporosinus sp. SB140]|uniref:NAD(P)/FAD-dependent oxidoreductase n=1 Tax=Desulfosporosinus paludis TaxID=3115649 RepID=UPI00388E1D68